MAEVSGCSVEDQLPQGTLVSGKEENFAELEKQGYRVKLLPDTNILEVGSYRIDIERGAPKTPLKLRVPKKLEKTWPHHLVQLAAPPSEEWIRAIEAHGVDVVEPISAYGLFVVGSPEEVSKLKSLHFVAWTGPFQPAYRLAPNLKGLKGRIQSVSVGVYPKTELPEVRAAIEKAGGTIREDRQTEASGDDIYGEFVADLDADKLPEMALLPAVRWIEFRGPDVLFDERSCQVVAENLDGAAAPNTAPVIGYQASLTALGINGAGVTIGIVDSGVDSHNNAAMQADLAGRMAAFVDNTGGTVTTDTNGHGTHVAGIAVGNAATGDTDPQGFLLGQGVAPASQFISINVIGTGGPFMSDDNRVLNVWANGGRVSNNSWGLTNGAGSGYTARSRNYDQRVRDPDPGTAGLEHLAIVAAAGNDGAAGASTIGAPWEAKNPIIVGNSQNFRPGEGDVDDIRGIRDSSSRGPAIDGRLLPTIVAPGTDIVSARSATTARPSYPDTGGTVHLNHTRLTGTSMASPHVAGICALLIEWWRNRTDGRNPSPALLKALLVNGAEDLVGGPDGAGGNLTNIPNNNQGWGRVSLENILLQAPALGSWPEDLLRSAARSYDGWPGTLDPGGAVLTWRDRCASRSCGPMPPARRMPIRRSSTISISKSSRPRLAMCSKETFSPTASP